MAGYKVNTPFRIAIVGAGFSGLSAAKELVSLGYEVEVFDKSRGPGGRACTRRREPGGFDHGAPYFEISSPGFIQVARQWYQQGFIAQWTGSFGVSRGGGIQPEQGVVNRWVGYPKMSALGRHLASGLNVRLQTRIERITGAAGQWTLVDETGAEYGEFDWVVFSCPGPQATKMIPDGCPLSDSTEHMEYAMCWVTMLEFAKPLSMKWNAIRFIRGALGSAFRENSKPGRDAKERWVVHADSHWSKLNEDRSEHWVSAALSESFASLTGASAAFVASHRWLYAQSAQRGIRSAMTDSQWQLTVCGDGLSGPGLDAAWSSGVTAAQDIHLSQRTKASHH